MTVQTAEARQNFLNAWKSLYPESNSDRRNCQLCHVLPTGGEPWNSYGYAIRRHYIDNRRLDIPAAITSVEPDNSDQDEENLTNLQEILSDLDPGWVSTKKSLGVTADGFVFELDAPFNDVDRRYDDGADELCVSLILNEDSHINFCL